jgi:hypothetical protein
MLRLTPAPGHSWAFENPESAAAHFRVISTVKLVEDTVVVGFLLLEFLIPLMLNSAGVWGVSVVLPRVVLLVPRAMLVAMW